MNENLISDCSAVILAGGKNSRYGGFHKAFLRIEDELIIERDLKLLTAVFDDVFIVANDVHLFENYKVPVYRDIYKNRGPLAGIHSALKNTRREAVMIFGCDMPFLDKELIIKMYKTYKASHKKYCLPKNEEFVEPLHAIYSVEILKDLENFLEQKKGNAVIKFLKGKDLCYMQTKVQGPAFVNINSPDDLSKIL